MSPASCHDRYDLDGARRFEQAQHLGADALARKLRKAGAKRERGRKSLRIRFALRIRRREAEEAQDAQVVLADALVRVADEAHPPGVEICIAAERIVDGPLAVAVERVDGEVAPARVLGPVVREGHGGMPAEGLDVAPERRDLERRVARRSP